MLEWRVDLDGGQVHLNREKLEANAQGFLDGMPACDFITTASANALEDLALRSEWCHAVDSMGSLMIERCCDASIIIYIQSISYRKKPFEDGRITCPCYTSYDVLLT